MVTLERLRAFAEAHKYTLFDLNDCFTCLAARLEGKPMYDSYGFEDGDRVPHAFGQFCEATYSPNHHRFLGSDLAASIGRVISGEHPVQVAHDLVAQYDAHATN